MKGIKYSIPYNKLYATSPNAESLNNITQNITSAKKTTATLQINMLGVSIKATGTGFNTYNLTLHILMAIIKQNKLNPSTIYLEIIRSPANVIDVCHII